MRDADIVAIGTMLVASLPLRCLAGGLFMFRDLLGIVTLRGYMSGGNLVRVIEGLYFENYRSYRYKAQGLWC